MGWTSPDGLIHQQADFLNAQDICLVVLVEAFPCIDAGLSLVDVGLE